MASHLADIEGDSIEIATILEVADQSGASVASVSSNTDTTNLASLEAVDPSANMTTSVADVNSSAAQIMTGTEAAQLTSSAELVGAEGFDEFAFFPKLPIELRLAIWKLALSSPRKITLYVDPVDGQDLMNRVPTLKTRTDLYTPTLLHVNNEARHVALDQYRIIFSMVCDKPIYYDETQDVVVFSSRACLDAWNRGVVEKFYTPYDIPGVPFVEEALMHWAVPIVPDYDGEDGRPMWIGSDVGTMLSGASVLFVALYGYEELKLHRVTFVHEEWNSGFAGTTKEDFFKELEKPRDGRSFLSILQSELPDSHEKLSPSFLPEIRHMKPEDFKAKFL